MTLVIDGLLTLLVGVSWLACLGFSRLHTPIDRLHCAAFVNVAAGAVLILLTFAADGASIRSCKVVLMVVVSLVAGAALSHAIGRAIVYRERFGAAGGDGA